MDKDKEKEMVQAFYKALGNNMCHANEILGYVAESFIDKTQPADIQYAEYLHNEKILQRELQDEIESYQNW